jgi:hypothetical protein
LLKALGIILLALVVIFLLAPYDIADYTLVDVKSGQRTEYGVLVKTSYQFNNKSDIERFPRHLEDWNGYDFVYPQYIYEAIDADIMLSRVYRNGDEEVWMDIINSKVIKSFHDPRICFGRTWDILNDTVEEINLVGNKSYIPFGKMFVNKLEMRHKKDANISLAMMYWFMFKPSFQERSITMIRLTSPVKGSFDQTFALMKSFLERELFDAMYQGKAEEARTIAENLIGVYGYAGYFVLLFFIAVPVSLIFWDKLKLRF